MVPKNFHLWAPALLRRALSRKPTVNGVIHVYFCITDHFEPAWRGADLSLQLERVNAWVEQYPRVAAPHHDSEGRHPQHTFFYPQDEYLPEPMDALATLCQRGWGDVEVHLHHDKDTPSQLRQKLIQFTETLYQRHGLLRKDARGDITYGFIHGNWALNNARSDGRWCGVNDETSILLETGCYADFTMPCAPNPSQSRKVNSIYYARPQDSPRAQDQGPDAKVGIRSPPGLLMIQGPLLLNWGSRKWGLLPHLETGDIAWHTPPTPLRARLWVKGSIQVRGAPQHVFIKISTHGAQDRNSAFLLNEGLDRTWSALEDLCRQNGYLLHYTTAYGLFQKIKQLEGVNDCT